MTGLELRLPAVVVCGRIGGVTPATLPDSPDDLVQVVPHDLSPVILGPFTLRGSESAPPSIPRLTRYGANYPTLKGPM